MSGTGMFKGSTSTALKEENKLANNVNPVFTHQYDWKASRISLYSLTYLPVKAHVSSCIHSREIS